MKVFRQSIVGRTSRRNERGATATEYGILVGFIAIVIIVAVTLFGTALNDVFGRLAIWVGTF
ncbi:Flp family type IVb pilin [Nocardioides sp. JQ2195]|uniref:Flp family type IVb pilin n=1 Tax=Nocardioides sp. JQ2195 TaxID=2592334 RepID=UPI00143E13A1|nr:Flp family type IVb pilin [Nocardioides sp. JQ2195]QIX28831.1 Flp family type IVb pilin [Nocardioides sp. JQ2195]